MVGIVELGKKQVAIIEKFLNFPWTKKIIPPHESCTLMTLENEKGYGTIHIGDGHYIRRRKDISSAKEAIISRKY